MSSFRTQYESIINGGTGFVAVTSQTGNFSTRTFQVMTSTNQGSIAWRTPTENGLTNPDVVVNATGGIGTKHIATVKINCSPFNSTEPLADISITTPSASPTSFVLSSTNTFIQQYSNAFVPVTTKLNYITGDYLTNYPIGYEGSEFKSALPDSDVYDAKFDLQIIDKELIATYKGTPIDDFACTAINWRLEYPIGTERNNQTLTINDNYTFTVDEYGQYKLTLSWLMDYGDYDPNCPETNQGAVNDTSLTFSIDGSTKTISGNDLECTPVFGVYKTNCVPKPIYRDCSQEYPVSITDIGNIPPLFACLIDNGVKAIGITIQGFFTPSPQFVNNKISSLKQQVVEADSFLTYTISWIVTTTGRLTSSSVNCQTPNVTYFAKTTTFDMCQMQTRFPTVWALATTVIRMGIVITILAVTFRALLELWRSKQ